MTEKKRYPIHRRYVKRQVRERPAFGITLVEILVSLGILSLLISLVAPALGRARSRGRVAACLANAQSINSAMVMYLTDDGRNLPWFYVHRIDETGSLHPYPGATDFSTFSWGGMLPRMSAGTLDAQMTPVELRPFSRYIAPAARGFDVVKSYVCPADNSASSPSFDSGTASASINNGPANWQVFGTSYSINWHWARSFDAMAPDIKGLDRRIMQFGPTVLREQSGGPASRMIWMSENHMDQLLNAASPSSNGQPAGVQAEGWHGNFSTHTGMFLDGHADHRYFDTRYTDGPGWTAAPARVAP